MERRSRRDVVKEWKYGVEYVEYVEYEYLPYLRYSVRSDLLVVHVMVQLVDDE
jgi:DNA-dependent RNA polymerase auxiliary subunit epsilon